MTPRNPGQPARLVLLRHGESEWNARDLFTGWVNVGLTAAGEREAARAGQLLADHGQLPGVVHTSLQRRAIREPFRPYAASWRERLAPQSLARSSSPARSGPWVSSMR